MGFDASTSVASSLCKDFHWPVQCYCGGFLQSELNVKIFPFLFSATRLRFPDSATSLGQAATGSSNGSEAGCWLLFPGFQVLSCRTPYLSPSDKFQRHFDMQQQRKYLPRPPAGAATAKNVTEKRLRSDRQPGPRARSHSLPAVAAPLSDLCRASPHPGSVSGSWF